MKRQFLFSFIFGLVVLLLWRISLIDPETAKVERSESKVIQEGNTLPQTGIQVKQSRELEDNRIGGDYGGELPSQGTICGMGLKWLRIGFWDSSLNWQKVESAPGTYTVASEWDEFVDDMVSNGITIILNLGVGSGRNRPNATKFKTKEDILRYANYVRFMVRHFKDRIKYYEIWNEPDTDTSWGGIAVDDYARLIKRVVPVIRQEYSEAKIVVGATGGHWSAYPGYGEFARYTLHTDYLKELLRSEVAPLVDVVSWHPFYGHRPDDPYYQNYPQIVENIRELATSQGFKGEYLVEEMLWRIKGAEEPQQPVSGIVSAKYLARAIVMHLGLNITVTASGMWPGQSPDVVRRLCTIMAGAKNLSLPIDVQSEANNISKYSFSLSNSEQLVALWTNGLGVDFNKGVRASLICRDILVQRVTGIDILNGVEQQIITDTQGGNLIIRNLRVPDYPIILRLLLSD